MNGCLATAQKGPREGVEGAGERRLYGPLGQSLLSAHAEGPGEGAGVQREWNRGSSAVLRARMGS